jgi:hypothetical protein
MHKIGCCEIHTSLTLGQSLPQKVLCALRLSL